MMLEHKRRQTKKATMQQTHSKGSAYIYIYMSTVECMSVMSKWYMATNRSKERKKSSPRPVASC